MEQLIPSLVLAPKNFRLGKRDINLLAQIEKDRELTLKEIEDLFWNGNGHRNHKKRIYQLIEQGLLIKINSPRYASDTFELTAQGYQLLFQLRLTSLQKPPKRPNYTNETHDRLMRLLARAFRSESSECTLYLEHQFHQLGIRKQPFAAATGLSAKIPDGLLILPNYSNQQPKIALELELTLKSGARYRDIFRKYCASNEWNHVIYIFYNDQTQKAFWNLLHGIGRKEPMIAAFINSEEFSTALFSEISQSPLRAPLIGKSHTQTLEQLAQKLSKAQNAPGDSVNRNSIGRELS